MHQFYPIQDIHEQFSHTDSYPLSLAMTTVASLFLSSSPNVGENVRPFTDCLELPTSTTSGHCIVDTTLSCALSYAQLPPPPQTNNLRSSSIRALLHRCPPQRLQPASSTLLHHCCQALTQPCCVHANANLIASPLCSQNYIEF